MYVSGRDQKLVEICALSLSQFLPVMYEKLISGEQVHGFFWGGGEQFAEVTFYYTVLQINCAVDSLTTMMSRKNNLFYVKAFWGHLVVCSPENHTGFCLFC
jgi:hypothetical protein